MGRLTTVLSICLVAVTLASCSKINICGKEDKLLGAWEYSSLVVGDSVYDIEIDLLALGIDSSDIDSIDVFSGLVFVPEGTYYTYNVIAPGTISTWRMDRYETDCLIYLEDQEFRWEITSLSKDQLDIHTFTLLPTISGEDSLVDVSIGFSKFSPEFLVL